MEDLIALRLQHWRQTPQTRITGPDSAVDLINQVGVATLFPASPEMPNLYHAFMGDPNAPTSPQWDSPSGQVYGWRWELGRPEAAFYTVLVRKRPTWVSWSLLPAVLRLRGELRTPDELYDLGAISPNAYRIVQALEASKSVLSTGDLRRAAGFPTGKDQRSAYLKAVDELDTRLLLAKVFSPDSEDMSHALVSVRYEQQVDEAERMTRDVALDRFFGMYLPHAAFAAPAILAKHLALPETEVRDGLDRLVERGRARRVDVARYKSACYAWTDT